MNYFILVLLAASCASLSNLCFRKCSSTRPATFLLFYYLISFLGSFLIRPDLLVTGWNPTAIAIGCVAGILNVMMMTITSRALQHTTAGITFTFQNASSVFPNFLLFLLLGSTFGFMVTGHQIVGMIFILLGLFAGIIQMQKEKTSKKIWLKYVLGCFFMQTLILCIFQARILIIPDTNPGDSDQWFMISFFGMALIFQTFLFFFGNKEKESTQLTKREITYGCISGLVNALSTFFLLKATLQASPIESGLIFPLFAVSVIVMCNCWEYFLYKEKPKLVSVFFCSSGIFIAALS